METTICAAHISGEIYPPCSKSYAQRAFATALLADGESLLHNIEFCDDTRTALKIIGDLGADTTMLDETSLRIKGGFAPRTDRVDTCGSGLAVRLFAPIAALASCPITIFSSQQQRKRTFDTMLRPLQELGVNATCKNGQLPIKLEGPFNGGEVSVGSHTSSQFLTGLLIALPLIEHDTILHVGGLDSEQYIEITLDVIERFGGKIEHNGFSEFFIRGGQRYTPIDYSIEGDWSSAAFWLVAGAITGEVTVNNMDMLSLQADTAIIEALQRAGVEIITTNRNISITHRHLHGFEFDATHHTDLFPILAILAANCEGTSTIKGASRLFCGDCDRGEAILEEFPKMGINIAIENGDDLVIKGGIVKGGRVSSRHDHRIAMAEAIAGLTSTHGVTIEASEAVTKSYPTFWNDLRNLTAGACFARK